MPTDPITQYAPTNPQDQIDFCSHGCPEGSVTPWVDDICGCCGAEWGYAGSGGSCRGVHIQGQVWVDLLAAIAAGTLVWEPAGTDEPGDQNADTRLIPHGYWALGPNDITDWTVELIETDEHGNEIPTGGIHLGHYPSEGTAKTAAAAYERDAARAALDAIDARTRTN